PERHGDAFGDVLPRKVEYLAGGRIAKGRDEYDLARVQAARDAGGVDLPDRPGELEIGALHHADGPRRDVVARRDADLRARHRRVRQSLRQQGLDLDPEHASGLLDRLQRALVGDSQSVRIVRADTARFQLRLDLWTRTVRQHEPDAERGQDADVVDEAREAGALGEHFATERHHERAAAKGVQIRRDLAEPAHEALGLLQRGHFVVSTNCKA